MHPSPSARTSGLAAVGEAAYAYRWVVLGLSVFVQTAVASATQGVPPLAPFYKQDLQLSRAQVGMLTGAISLGQVPTLLVAGWLTDIVGIRLMLVVGQVVTGVAITGLVFANSFEMAAFLLFVAGVGSGIGNPAVTKAIVHWFPLRSRGTAMGVKQTGVPLGGAIFAAILPALALTVGWRHSALALGGFDLAMGILSLALYREAPHRPAGGGAPSHTRTAIREVLMNRHIWIAGFLAGVLVGTQFSLTTYLMLYLRDVLLVPIVVAGVVLAGVQVTGLVARIFWGLVSDRLLKGRRKPVMLFSGAGSTLVMVLFSMVQPGIPLVLVVLLTIAIGFTAVGWHGVFMVLLSETAGVERAATAVGMGMTVSTFGGMVIPPLFGLVADTVDYHWAWLFLAAATAAGTLVFLFMREIAPEE